MGQTHPFRFSISRRAVVLTGLLATQLAFGSTAVQAQSNYPNKPVRIVLMYPAGGGAADPQARLIAQKLKDEIGQPVVVDNKPGAGGIIAAESVLSAPADGHNLLSANVTVMVLTPKFNTAAKYSNADFVPVVFLGATPYTLLARNEFPANDFDELVTLAKRKPGSLTYGTWGPGSGPHAAGEWIGQERNFQWTAVPYKGESPMLQDMLGNQIQLGWISLATALPYLKSGQLKALGITSPERNAMVPNVRTFIEQGVPNFTIQGWMGLFAKKGTPPETVKLLHTKIDKILQTPELKEQAKSAGFNLQSMSTEQFNNLVKTDTDRMMPTLDRLAPSLRQ